MRLSRSRQRGFTFLEMALVLFAMGFLMAALPRLLTQGTQVMATSPGATPVEAVQLGLNGFVRIHARLPCPASTPLSGAEDCALSSGFVPWIKLGLARPATNSDGFGLAYAVLQDSANDNQLTVTTAKYTPTYFYTAYSAGSPPAGSYWLAPPAKTTTAANSGTNIVNGLDFCAKLRHAATLGEQAAQTGIRNVRNPAQRINVAWVLVDPGQRNADGVAGSYPEFDGVNQPGTSNLFESPSQPQTGSYDDRVTVGTLNQLFGEMHCPELLASVSAAARETDFANDNLRVRSFLYDFRDYELKVRKQKKTQADNSLILASFDITMNVALGALDLGIALASASGAATIAVSLINAVTSISLSAYNLTEAIAGVASAVAEVTEGEARLSDASAAATAAFGFRTAREAALLLLDQRGWFE